MRAVLDTLTPVFLVIVTGMLLRWTRRLSDEALRGMNWLVFWVALPALLFREIASVHRFGFGQVSIFLILLAGMAACILGGYALAAVMKMPALFAGTTAPKMDRS